MDPNNDLANSTNDAGEPQSSEGEARLEHMAEAMTKSRLDLFKSATRDKMQKAMKLLILRRRLAKGLENPRDQQAPYVPVDVKDKRGSMQASVIAIIAIIQSICGFVFPVCDAFALTDSGTQFAINHKYYMEAFLFSQYMLAIVSLAYLQLLIHCYQDANYCNNIHSTNEKPATILEPNVLEMGQLREGTTPECEQDDIDETNSVEGPSVSIPSTSPTDRLQHILGETKDVQKKKKKYDKLSWHPYGLNLYMRLGAVGFGMGVMIHDGFNLSSAWELTNPTCRSVLWIPKHSIRLFWVLWQTYFIFKYHKVMFLKHRFTVRLAFTHLIVANLGHGLKVVIGEISEALKVEDLNSMGSLSTVHPLLTQMLQMFKHQITASHSAEASSLVNTTETNTTAIAHIVEKYLQQNQPTHTQNLSSIAACQSHIGRILRPYLFPMAIEYSLIASTLVYKLLQRVGRHNLLNEGDDSRKTSNNGDNTNEQSNSTTPMFGLDDMSFNMALHSMPGTSFQNLTTDGSKEPHKCIKHESFRSLLGCRVYLPNTPESLHDSASDESSRSEEAKSIRPSDAASKFRENYCHRSHTGLFLGLMVFIATVIGTISFFAPGKIHLFFTEIPVYQYTKIILLSMGTVATVLALIQTSVLNFRRLESGENFEYTLLGIGLIGCLIYFMLLFVPALETIVHLGLYRSTPARLSQNTHMATNQTLTSWDLDHLSGTATIYTIKSILEILQASIQFFFIVESSQRGPCCLNQSAIKPGRSALVFLLILNLSLWVVNTFEVRQAEYQLVLHRKFYGLRTWSVITCCFIPLIIFFRFHSTICLAQIWSTLYQQR